MSGYVKSPDYGGPGKVNWRTVNILLAIAVLFGGIVLLRQ